MNNPSSIKLTFLASATRRTLLLLGTLLVAGALAGCSQPSRQRKNVKDLTTEEKQDYVDAVLKLKSTPSPYDPTLSWYDQFVDFHRKVFYYRPEARPSGQKYQIGHQSPSFLPWHRKFLAMYEQALREVSGKDISLPYWDWTDPASTDAVFSKDFMGGGGVAEEHYAVREGPFRKDAWEVKVFPFTNSDDVINKSATPQENTTPYLTRSLGNSGATQLPTAADMDMCLEVGTYDESPWDGTADRMKSFRNCLEGWGHGGEENPTENHLHNSAHIWVGGVFQDNGQTVMGSMAAVDTSPNDPVFFLHHANVDRIWALWEQRYGVSYVFYGDGYDGWNAGDPLYPFSEEQYRDDFRVKLYGNTVGDMLDMSKLDYEYR